MASSPDFFFVEAEGGGIATKRPAAAANGARRHDLIAPLLGLALDLAASWRRDAAAAMERRFLLHIAAGIGGAAALACFSAAALVLLKEHMQPAGAWAVLGIFYAALGGILYGVTRLRR